MSLKKTTLLPLLAVMLPAMAAAQDVGGDLEGRLLDEEGKPIAYANVVATSTALQGARGTLSNPDGKFRIIGLPIGIYTINISHVSYQPLTLEEVFVQLGRTTTLPASTLSTRVHEAPKVVVVAQKPLIDINTTSLQTTLDSDFFENLPIDRNFTSIVELAPQANASYFGDGINISGSTGVENIYFIDGIHMTDPNFHNGVVNLPYNFVREVEVKTGGYEAEYGRSIGGIVNAVTQSGSNELQGQLFGFFTNNDFAASRSRALIESTIGDYALFDFGGSLGGPLVRDKLWFYAAYNPTMSNGDILLPGLGPENDETRIHLFAGKLTWRVSNRTRVDLTALGDPGRHEGIAPVLEWAGAVAGLENPDPLLVNEQTGGVALSIQARHQLAKNAYLEAVVSRVGNRNTTVPATTRGETEPLYKDMDGIWSGGVGGFYEDRGARWAGKLVGAVSVSNHEVKLGVEYEDNAAELNQEFGAGKRGAGTITERPDSTWEWFQAYTLGTVRNRIPSVFVQDTWSVTRQLRLNVGIRWDAQYIESYDGQHPLSISDQWQPRLGVTYELSPLKSRKLFGSYGRFYQQLSTLSPGYYFQDALFLYEYYDYDPRLPGPGPFESFRIGLGGADTDVRGQHFDEFVLGYEQILYEQLKFGVRGIYRTLREIIEDSYDPISGDFFVGNPGRGALSHMERPRRDYTGLEVTLENSGRGRTRFLASYALSKVYGNYPGVAGTDLRGNIGNGNFSYDFPEQLVNGTGNLPNDRRHVFKLSGSYRFDFGLTAGTWFSAQSGTPLSEYGTAAVGNPYWTFITQRGTAGHLPTLWDLNLRLSYDLQQSLGTRASSKLILDLLHILNQQTVVDVDQRHYLGQDEDGNPIGENPNYLQPTRLQPSLAARLGFVFGF